MVQSLLRCPGLQQLLVSSKSVPGKQKGGSISSSSQWSKTSCHSHRNLVGRASDASHLLYRATLGLMGGTLHQRRVRIGRSGAGGHADWVRGRGRGGAGGGGGGEGLAAIGPTERFHLDQLIQEIWQEEEVRREEEEEEEEQSIRKSGFQASRWFFQG